MANHWSCFDVTWLDPRVSPCYILTMYRKNTISHGDKFSRLTFIAMVSGSHFKENRIGGEFVCDCGNRKVLPIGRVVSGYIQSCGCLVNERGVAKTHGMRYSPEYRIWGGIKTRVCNPKSKDYKRYSQYEHDLAILKSFEAFYAEVGPRPGPGYSIDRIDNTRGYQKGNMRWATQAQQVSNKHSTILVTINGIDFESAASAARYFGVTRTTVGRWMHGFTDPRRNKAVGPKEGVIWKNKY
jgi:hypothetical protein